MEIKIIQIGKTNETYIEQGVQEYNKRLSRYCKLTWLTIPKVKNAVSLSPFEIIEKEGQLVMEKIQDNDFLVLMDEKGKQYTSEKFAAFLQLKMNHSAKLVFLIGGAYGTGTKLKSRANAMLSLSEMTFSHQLIRVIFAEQLYRAFSIIHNEPYHNA